jgi:three-Cys-motif partner protein
MDPPDFFLKHATKLKNTVMSINSISPEIANEYRAHTALKLFCVGYWSEVFTTIMKKKKIPSIYIDLFAGSGLTKVIGSDKLLPGSPIVAETYGTGYNHIICVDSNERYTETLKQRLSALRNKKTFDIFCCKNEEVIDDIVKIVKEKKGMVFCFYDPEGYEGFSWNVLNKIGTKLRGDILITWFENGLWRNLSAGNDDLLTRVYGDKSWSGSKNPKELTQKFMDKLSNIRDNINPVEIVDESRTVYHEILCVKETKGGSPFLRAWDNVGIYLQNEGARLTNLWLDIAYEKQSQLFDPKFQ